MKQIIETFETFLKHMPPGDDIIAKRDLRSLEVAGKTIQLYQLLLREDLEGAVLHLRRAATLQDAAARLLKENIDLRLRIEQQDANRDAAMLYDLTPAGSRRFEAACAALQGFCVGEARRAPANLADDAIRVADAFIGQLDAPVDAETEAEQQRLWKEHLIRTYGVSDSTQQRAEDLLVRSLDSMEFSVRVINNLQAAGLRTINDLVQLTEAQLLKQRNFGRNSVKEVKELLAEMGLKLKES